MYVDKGNFHLFKCSVDYSYNSGDLSFPLLEKKKGESPITFPLVTSRLNESGFLMSTNILLFWRLTSITRSIFVKIHENSTVLD